MIRACIAAIVACASLTGTAAAEDFDESSWSYASGSSSAASVSRDRVATGLARMQAFGPIVEIACVLRRVQTQGYGDLYYSGSTVCDITASSITGFAYIQHPLGTTWDQGNRASCSSCSSVVSRGEALDAAVSGYTYHYYYNTTVTLPPGWSWIYPGPSCSASGSRLPCTYYRKFTFKDGQ